MGLLNMKRLANPRTLNLEMLQNTLLGKSFVDRKLCDNKLTHGVSTKLYFKTRCAE